MAKNLHKLGFTNVRCVKINVKLHCYLTNVHLSVGMKKQNCLNILLLDLVDKISLYKPV